MGLARQKGRVYSTFIKTQIYISQAVAKKSQKGCSAGFMFIEQ